MMNTIESVDSSKNLSTRERILDAAEQLFAISGFAETSMRDITKHANVNLAAINYHFGSKDDLINEVFIRCLDPIHDVLQENMDNLIKEAAEPSKALKHIVELVVIRAFQTEQQRHNGAIFMRLLNRAYNESQGKLRSFLAERYKKTLIDCVRFFRLTLPQVQRAEVFWRIHFMLGSLAFAVAGEKEIGAIGTALYQDQHNEKALLRRLTNFLVAGLQAEA